MGMCEHMHSYVHMTRSVTVASFVTVIIYRYILYYINPLLGMACKEYTCFPHIFCDIFYLPFF